VRRLGAVCDRSSGHYGVQGARDLTPALPAFVSPRQTEAPAVFNHAGWHTGVASCSTSL
jgi:hypothetical protein